MHNGRLLSSSFTSVAWATVAAHRTQESLSLTTFKRKQLRLEPYPSLPPPPLGPSFLPLSRTDTLSVFFCPESRHIYSALCSAHLNSHHTSCSFPFPFPFFPFPSICCPGIAHWSHIQSLMWAQALTHTSTYTQASFGSIFFYPGFWSFGHLKDLNSLYMPPHLFFCFTRLN